MAVVFYLVGVYLFICLALCLHMLIHLAIGRRARLLVGPADRQAMRTTRPPFRPLIAVR